VLVLHCISITYCTGMHSMDLLLGLASFVVAAGTNPPLQSRGKQVQLQREFEKGLCHAAGHLPLNASTSSHHGKMCCTVCLVVPQVPKPPVSRAPATPALHRALTITSAPSSPVCH
jgi:hypothetical protein